MQTDIVAGDLISWPTSSASITLRSGPSYQSLPQLQHSEDDRHIVRVFGIFCQSEYFDTELRLD